MKTDKSETSKSGKTKDDMATNPESITNSEKEPISAERSAKKDKNFTTVETKLVKGKESVPLDSTAQRGKTPVSPSKDSEKNEEKNS